MTPSEYFKEVKNLEDRCAKNQLIASYPCTLYFCDILKYTKNPSQIDIDYPQQAAGLPDGFKWLY